MRAYPHSFLQDAGASRVTIAESIDRDAVKILTGTDAARKRSRNAFNWSRGMLVPRWCR
jgi:hypothetical protein